MGERMTYYNVCTVRDCPNREITAGGNCGGVRWDENGVVIDWGIVGEPGHKGVITNADRIRAMTDEELAGYIRVFFTEVCPPGKCPGEDDCYNCWLSWLKSPAKEEMP